MRRMMMKVILLRLSRKKMRRMKMKKVILLLPKTLQLMKTVEMEI